MRRLKYGDAELGREKRQEELEEESEEESEEEPEEEGKSEEEGINNYLLEYDNSFIKIF